MGASCARLLQAGTPFLELTALVIPLAWAGDRFDKRLVLLGVLGVGAGVYALFPLVSSSLSFVAIRALQGVVVTGSGLMSLSLVGQIATTDTQAEKIGRANAGLAVGASIAVPILGTLPPAYLPLVAFLGLLGVADSFREPVRMVPFADEGGVASSFGVRELV